jgi:type I restriction enzyme S subunit
MSLKALGETAQFINGAAFKPTDWANDGLPIIRIQNLTGSGEKFNYTTRQVKPELIVEPGDLLVSWSATLDVYRWAGPRGVLNQHIFKVLPKPGIDPDYLFFALKTALSELMAKTHGSTMKHVVRGDFESTRVTVPPLPEQRRIVDLLTRAGGIVRLRREAENKAAELIPALFLNMFGHISPTEYQKAEKLCAFITKGTTPKTSEISTTNDGKRVPFLKVLHITDDGRADFERQPAFVSQALHRGLLARSVVRPNDVLMNIVGPPLGRICLVSATYSEWNINQALAIFRTKADILPTYLFYALRSPLVLPNIFRLPVGVRQLNISLQQCRNIEVPVPAMVDQRKFVEKAEQVRSIQSQQSDATAKAQATFDALLARCFTPSVAA